MNDASARVVTDTQTHTKPHAHRGLIRRRKQKGAPLQTDTESVKLQPSLETLLS